MDNDDEPVGRDQAKQRKVLLLLAPLMVILLVIQGPTLLGLITGSGDDEVQVDETVATTAAAGESALGPDVANAAVPAEPVFVIVDSDLPPRADEDELTLLSRFDQRDPFIPGVDGSVGGDISDESDEGSSAEDADAAAAAAAEEDAAGGGDDEPISSDEGDAGDTAGEPAEDIDGNPTASGNDQSTEARIQVNGAASVVRVGSAFPSFDPVFRLESLAGDAVRVGLVRGSYSTGSELVDIQPGETRTLISQPDGTRYRIRLVELVS